MGGEAQPTAGGLSHAQGRRYGRNTKAEWLKTSRTLYGEAIRSAEEMGLELEVWIGDAIQFHAYRCEAERLTRQYEMDCRYAAETRKPTPLQTDYKPRKPAPQMSPAEISGRTRTRQEFPAVSWGVWIEEEHPGWMIWGRSETRTRIEFRTREAGEDWLATTFRPNKPPGHLSVRPIETVIEFRGPRSQQETGAG